jgi:hypothetical protein
VVIIKLNKQLMKEKQLCEFYTGRSGVVDQSWCSRTVQYTRSNGRNLSEFRRLVLTTIGDLECIVSGVPDPHCELAGKNDPILQKKKTASATGPRKSHNRQNRAEEP